MGQHSEKQAARTIIPTNKFVCEQLKARITSCLIFPRRFEWMIGRWCVVQLPEREKNHQDWCFVQVSEVRIQFELTTESNYKGSYREKSIHFWKRLLSCGVIRLELSKASYNYQSKCATKSHQSYFLSIAKSRERNHHCKLLRPYPSQCHLVLVRMIFSFSFGPYDIPRRSAMSVKDSVDTWSNRGRQKLMKRSIVRMKKATGRDRATRKMKNLILYCSMRLEQNASVVVKILCKAKIQLIWLVILNYKGALTAGVEHPLPPGVSSALSS